MEFTNFETFNAWVILSHYYKYCFVVFARTNSVFDRFLLQHLPWTSCYEASPWGATTLEWTTLPRPGHGNWEGDIPTVHRWAYDYLNNGDVGQHVPMRGR